MKLSDDGAENRIMHSRPHAGDLHVGASRMDAVGQENDDEVFGRVARDGCAGEPCV